jgi:hypothetical protein
VQGSEGLLQGAEEIAASPRAFPSHLQAASTGSPLAALTPSSDKDTGAAATATAAAATVANALAQDEQQLLQLWSQHVQSWGDSFGLGAVQGLWHVGQLLVPLSWGVLAASRPDILHGIYLLAMVGWMLAINCKTIPSLPRSPCSVKDAFVQQGQQERLNISPEQQQEGGQRESSSGGNRGLGNGDQEEAVCLVLNALPAVTNPRYSLFRIYATAHLLVIYSALVLQLPGLKSDFNERVLQLVGLLDPRMITDLVPVLIVLLMATVHEALGKWLLSKPVEGFNVHAAGQGQAAQQGLAIGVQGGLAAADQSRGSEPSATAREFLQGQVVDMQAARVAPAASAGSVGATAAAAAGVPGPTLLLWWLVAVQPRLLSQAMLRLGRSTLFAGMSAYVLVVRKDTWAAT